VVVVVGRWTAGVYRVLYTHIGEFVQPSGRILQSRAESQRIAAWELLYRVRHPGRYVSRLQTILHSDITVNDCALEDDQHDA